MVRPIPGYLTHASGTVHTPKGDVQAAWRKENEALRLSVNCADALRERLVIEA